MNICNNCGIEVIKRKRYCPICKIIKRKEVANNYAKKNFSSLKDYRKLKEEKIKEYMKEYYSLNKNNLNEVAKINYRKNKKIYSEKWKIYYINNSDQIKKRAKDHLIKIKSDPILNEKFLRKRRIYNKEYRKKNPHVTIIRNQIRHIIESLSSKKTKGTWEELGYNKDEFKVHIELQFISGMSWENIGLIIDKWSIDHKIPISWFKRETPISIVNSLENLQPRWFIDNRKKWNLFSDPISSEFYSICLNYIKEDKLKSIKIL